jgi:hypothetical protein
MLLGAAIVSLPALGYFELLGQRESYKLLESFGAIEGTGSYWGQILRYNVPHHAEWVRTWVRVASGAAAFAALLAVLVAAYGAALLTLGCAPASLLPTARRYALPAAAAPLIFGLVLTLTAERVDDLVYEGLYDLADLFGCQYVIISGMRMLMLDGHGPFQGGGAACAALNLCYVHVWPVSPLIAPTFAAAAAFWWLSPKRPVNTQDVCAVCGYSLEGLASAACPECGGRNQRF